MALGSTGDPDLANAVANAVGKELRQVGINWVYSPVADVNLEPFNPVIGTTLAYLLNCLLIGPLRR